MFSFFKKKKAEQPANEKKTSTKPDYGSIPEIVRILTNGNKQAIEDMTLLSSDFKSFTEKYHDWCEEMFDGISEDLLPLYLPYWLTGYDTEHFTPPYSYGAYIDWKEEPEEIIWGLQKPVENLAYPLVLSDIDFNEDEDTEETLARINRYCGSKGYKLVSVDTESDCYHLFIVKSNDYSKLLELAGKANFKIFETLA